MDRITAAFYARVSSDGQTRGNTVASQVAALRERSAADDAAVSPDHSYVDEGWSGTALTRPALERLRDAIAAGELDRVYVLAPDRLARRYAYQVLLVEGFRRAGVEVVFLNRAIGGSAEDDLLLQVQGMIAEYERARILERSRRGRRHAALSGAVSALCAMPYGYRYLGRYTAGGTARVEVVEEEARMVRQLFDWVGVERISCATPVVVSSPRSSHQDRADTLGRDHVERHASQPCLPGHRDVRADTRNGASAAPAAPHSGPPSTIPPRLQFVNAGATRGVDHHPGAGHRRGRRVRGRSTAAR